MKIFYFVRKKNFQIHLMLFKRGYMWYIVAQCPFELVLSISHSLSRSLYLALFRKGALMQIKREAANRGWKRRKGRKGVTAGQNQLKSSSSSSRTGLRFTPHTPLADHMPTYFPLVSEHIPYISMIRDLQGDKQDTREREEKYFIYWQCLRQVYKKIFTTRFELFLQNIFFIIIFINIS